jgi:hypothetical protein
MPQFLLRRNVVVKAYHDEFLVLLTMDDRYELEVGHISKQTGAHMHLFWAWACPGSTGREETLEKAIAAFRAAWRSTDAELAEMRNQQERTEDKYALFEAGYKPQIAAGEIRCPCGARFDPGDHDAIMDHIGHIKAGRDR